MPMLVLDPAPPELERLKERRRELGQDRRDEVWEGVYRMVPAPGEAHWLLAQQLAELLGPLARAKGLVPGPEFNLGEPGDYRVPDAGLHRPRERGDWRSTAALVVEIVSPNDESWRKLPFYAAHGVDEVLIVDPAERSVHWLARSQGSTSQSPRSRVSTSQSTEEPGNDAGTHAGGYRETDRSALIDLGPAELAASIEWP